MRIRLALLDTDGNYLTRIASVFSIKYGDRLELHSFTDKAVALAALAEEKIDVFIASDTFDIDVSGLPTRCGFAYFVDSASVEAVNGQPAICKFQKAELIYKRVLAIFSDRAGNVSMQGAGDGNVRVVAFASPCGGTGTSSMAAAYAARLAGAGKRPIYLNLETFGTATPFFQGEGRFGMEDVIYAIKSKRANLQMKLESCVKQDRHGVCFYDPAPMALDMMELTTDEILELISEIGGIGTYSHIILDMDFDLTPGKLRILHQANLLVWVADGSEQSCVKIKRAYESLVAKEKNIDHPLTESLVLIYNKFSNKTGRTVELDIKSPGGTPRLEHATTQQILEHLSGLKFLDSIE